MKDTLNYFSLCDPSYLMQLQTATYDTIFSEIEIDSSYVPDGPDCAYIQHGWITHHYEPKDGKLVGVWPVDCSVSNLTNLRLIFGYSGIFLPHDQTIYNNAISAGFSNSNMMMDIQFNPNWGDFVNVVNTYNVKYYYTGESVEHSCFGNGNLNHRLYNPSELQVIKDYIHTNRPNSYYVSDGYKRCMHLNVLSFYTDFLMFSAYSHWYLPFIATPCFTNMSFGSQYENAWWEGDENQRPDWSDMKNRYGSKFSMTWINTKEIGEFDLLLGHAQNLGLYGIWIYSGDGHHNDQWENISYAAWKHGFLRRWVQDVTITW